MGSICRRHLLIPAGEVLDVEALLPRIHQILVEGYEYTTDHVAIELELKPQSVLVICSGTWKYQIYLTVDKNQLLIDSWNWIRVSGRNLTRVDRQNFLSSFPRLDIYCGVDEDHNFDNAFNALTLHLQMNLNVCYSFDPMQSTFIVHRDEEE